MLLEPVVSAYRNLLPAFTEAGAALQERLEEWLRATPGLKVHSVRMRVKDPASLRVKLARPDKTYGHLFDVTDLVGLRIIAFFDDEVDAIGRLVEERLPVDFEHSVDKRRLQVEGRFGYRSLHYVCRLPGVAPLLGDAAPPIRCEIQIRTMLEHAWAEIEHDLGYKARDTVPAAVRRRLQRVAGLLELADEEFVAIREDLDDYAARLPARIAASERVALDRLSLGRLLDLPECRDLDEAVAAHLGLPLSTSAFFPEYVLRMLEAAGLETVSDVRRVLAELRGAALALVDPYFRFASRMWGLGPETFAEIHRGYGLLFICHAHVLGPPLAASGDLAVNTVMRVASFYARFDYPGNEREAQRVASVLVETLRTAGVAG
jgi:putative GTP pyrophosphokinase